MDFVQLKLNSRIWFAFGEYEIHTMNIQIDDKWGL